MLNKELLLAAGPPTVEGHIKLTVGTWRIGDASSIMNGYQKNPLCGSLSKVPLWYDKNKTSLLTLIEFSSGGLSGDSVIYLDPIEKEPIKTLKATVVEKNTTVIFTSTLFYGMYYLGGDTKNLFKDSDVGKTFNIIFDPPPDSYA